MKNRLLKAFALVCALMVGAAALSACSTTPAANSAAAASTTAAANLPSKLVIAYLPNEADEKLTESRKGFADELSKAIGIPVEEYLSNDYSATVEAMRTGKADMADFGPLTFVQAVERANAIPLATAAKNGDKKLAVYQSLIIVKADSAIQSIKDIKGKSIAFVDPNSTSGNLVPSAEIIKNFPDDKLTIDDLHTNGKFFNAVSFSGKHQASIQAVIKGDVDVAPCASDTLAAEVANGNVAKDSYRVIYTSADIPSSPYAVRGDLDPALREKIKQFLLGYSNEKYFTDFLGDKTKRFVEMSIDDYKGIMELAKQLQGN